MNFFFSKIHRKNQPETAEIYRRATSCTASLDAVTSLAMQGKRNTSSRTLEISSSISLPFFFFNSFSNPPKIKSYRCARGFSEMNNRNQIWLRIRAQNLKARIAKREMRVREREREREREERVRERERERKREHRIFKSLRRNRNERENESYLCFVFSLSLSLCLSVSVESYLSIYSLRLQSTRFFLKRKLFIFFFFFFGESINIFF